VRRTRHRRRFHTDRIVRNRRARYWREMPSWWRGEQMHRRQLAYGALADRDPRDCGSHCLLCHHDKFLEPRRARENRTWRRDWGL